MFKYFILFRISYHNYQKKTFTITTTEGQDTKLRPLHGGQPPILIHREQSLIIMVTGLTTIIIRFSHIQISIRMLIQTHLNGTISLRQCHEVGMEEKAEKDGI